MEITKALTMGAEEPLSKAINELMDSATAVVITKSGKYYGIIDDRNMRYGITDPKSAKCETCVVKPPTLHPGASVLEQINAFMNGHFKALPVVDDDGKPLGITSRVELLKAMVDAHLIPKIRTSELMSSPVYTIEESEQIAKAKNLMREYGVRRLVVIRKGVPVGAISTLDLASYITKPKEQDKRQLGIQEVDNILSRSISEFLRPDITTIDEKSTLEEASLRMVEKCVSAIVITSGNKPAGVLSALDIFKKIQELVKEEITISVSGLGEERVWQYPEVRNRVGAVLTKFSKSFNLRNVSVHVKEEKSIFEVFIYLDTDDGHISLSSERKDLKEAVDELSDELDRVLSRKKDKRHQKTRRVHSGNEEEEA